MIFHSFDIKVALLGYVSVGKSTVLNALFRDKYSEVSMRRTTAGINFFRFTNGKQEMDGSAEETDWCPDAQEPREATSTLEETIADNKVLRTTSVIKEKTFDIELDEPLCEMRNDTSLVIVDIPGLNEAGSSKMYMDYVSRQWDTYDCVIVVMDAEKGVNTEEQVSLLKFVREKRMVNDVPVIVLCNKVDDPDHEEIALMVDEVRATVEEVFEVDCRKAALNKILNPSDSQETEDIAFSGLSPTKDSCGKATPTSPSTCGTSTVTAKSDKKAATTLPGQSAELPLSSEDIGDKVETPTIASAREASPTRSKSGDDVVDKVSEQSPQVPLSTETTGDKTDAPAKSFTFGASSGTARTLDGKQEDTSTAPTFSFGASSSNAAREKSCSNFTGSKPASMGSSVTPSFSFSFTNNTEEKQLGTTEEKKKDTTPTAVQKKSPSLFSAVASSSFTPGFAVPAKGFQFGQSSQGPSSSFTPGFAVPAKGFQFGQSSQGPMSTETTGDKPDARVRPFTSPFGTKRTLDGKEEDTSTAPTFSFGSSMPSSNTARDRPGFTFSKSKPSSMGSSVTPSFSFSFTNNSEEKQPGTTEEKKKYTPRTAVQKESPSLFPAVASSSATRTNFAVPVSQQKRRFFRPGYQTSNRVKRNCQQRGSGPVRFDSKESPAFIPISAENAFVYRTVSRLQLKDFEKLDQDVIDRLGIEEAGRMRWKAMSLEEKYSVVHAAVSDPSTYKQRLEATNFETFLKVLTHFVGGVEKQTTIIMKQIDVATSRMIKTKRGIASQLRSICEMSKVVEKTTDHLKGTFWMLYGLLEKDAFLSLHRDMSLGALHRCMDELVDYISDPNKIIYMDGTAESSKAEKARVLATMKELVERQCMAVLQERSTWTIENASFLTTPPRVTGDVAGSTINPDLSLPTWSNLSPDDWMTILNSILLMGHEKHFAVNFGPTINELELCKAEILLHIHVKRMNVRHKYLLGTYSEGFFTPDDPIKYRLVRQIKMPESPADSEHWGHLAWKFCELKKTLEQPAI